MRALGVLALVAACGGAAAPPPPERTVPAPPADAIAKTTETGPVKATIRVWPAKPVLGEPIYARLEIEAPAGITVEAPLQEAGDDRLGRFRVLAFLRATSPSPSGQRQEQTYTLEATTSGRHRVPPLRLEIVDARGSDTTRPQELLTDEIALEVAPVPAQAADAPLRGSKGELDPEVSDGRVLLAIALGVLVVALGVGGVVAYRVTRTRRRVAQQRSAYEDAVTALRQLAARGAPDAASADEWFVTLSAIVRRYLEHRYEIRAPELTTEEFLNVATARPELHADHRALLTSFLERCDRVKFAGYRPDATESLATLEAARAFVEDTRLREPAGRAA